MEAPNERRTSKQSAATTMQQFLGEEISRLSITVSTLEKRLSDHILIEDTMHEKLYTEIKTLQEKQYSEIKHSQEMQYNTVCAKLDAIDKDLKDSLHGMTPAIHEQDHGFLRRFEQSWAKLEEVLEWAAREKVKDEKKEARSWNFRENMMSHMGTVVIAGVLAAGFWGYTTFSSNQATVAAQVVLSKAQSTTDKQVEQNAKLLASILDRLNETNSKK